MEHSLGPRAVAELRLVRCDMAQTEVPEGMVNLAHALVETQHLRAWFYALEGLPVSFRETAFSEMAVQMRNGGGGRETSRGRCLTSESADVPERVGCGSRTCG